jgi:transcriptional regulator with XRE-family HTH domain
MQNVVDKKFLKALGKRVKELRLSKKVTQEELGFRIGNSGKQIGRVERGEHNVSTCMIYAISKALDIPIKEFFDI